MSFLQHSLFAIINFAIFVVILWALLKNQVGLFLSSRRTRFKLLLENVERRRNLAYSRLEKCEGRLRRLGDEVADILEDMRRRGAQEQDAIIAGAEDKVRIIRRDAQRWVEHDLQQMRRNLYRSTARAALVRAEHELAAAVTEDRARAVLARSLALVDRELRARGAGGEEAPV